MRCDVKLFPPRWIRSKKTRRIPLALVIWNITVPPHSPKGPNPYTDPSARRHTGESSVASDDDCWSDNKTGVMEFGDRGDVDCWRGVDRIHQGKQSVFAWKRWLANTGRKLDSSAIISANASPTACIVVVGHAAEKFPIQSRCIAIIKERLLTTTLRLWLMN